VTWSSKTFASVQHFRRSQSDHMQRLAALKRAANCGGIIQSIFAPEAATTFPILVHPSQPLYRAVRVMGENIHAQSKKRFADIRRFNSLCISTLSLLTISDGYSEDQIIIPDYDLEIGYPASATVGRSGKAAERFKPVTASPRRLPFRTSSSTAVRDQSELRLPVTDSSLLRRAEYGCERNLTCAHSQKAIGQMKRRTGSRRRAIQQPRLRSCESNEL